VTRRQPRPLAPIGPRVMRPTFRGGRRRLECWAAETADGAWHFERQEAPGTPWAIGHVATHLTVAYAATLNGCRWYVAAGHAAGDLDRVLAHRSGGHAGTPDFARCGECRDGRDMAEIAARRRRPMAA
jgi:hypothetical protein